MGRRLERKEKGISFSIFYLKYFLYLFLAVAAICIAALFSLGVLVSGNMIYPADYAQKQAEAARENIENAMSVSEDFIPDLCQYVIFDLDGNMIDGNMDKGKVQTAWEAVLGKKTDYIWNVYKVIEREGQYCVLQYKIIPQYKSAILRKYLCPPQTLILTITLLLILFSVVIIAVRFGHVLKRKMNPLILATEKIQKQDLDFSIETGNIKEINSILAAMDKMREELKHSLESQWKAEQSRKEQISALAHDLKTPLTIVRGNAEILYDTNLTEEQTECIHYIEESSLQMQDYIKMLIEITKNTNLHSPQTEKISVSDFVQNIQKTAKGLCLPKNISLQWEFRSALKYFNANSNLLSRALNNILSNAVENSPSGGNIGVDIHDENGYLIFAVRDSGKGFSNEAIKYATTQFYMDDTSRNSKLHFGIGLYVTDMIVKQHGGELVLENLEESAGAKVTIKIPVIKIYTEKQLTNT